jgi:hypothetical protein
MRTLDCEILTISGVGDTQPTKIQSESGLKALNISNIYLLDFYIQKNFREIHLFNKILKLYQTFLFCS